MDILKLRIIRVFKNGNGLAVIIPAQVARELKVSRGDYMGYNVREGDILCFWKLSAEDFAGSDVPVIKM